MPTIKEPSMLNLGIPKIQDRKLKVDVKGETSLLKIIKILEEISVFFDEEIQFKRTAFSYKVTARCSYMTIGIGVQKYNRTDAYIATVTQTIQLLRLVASRSLETANQSD